MRPAFGENLKLKEISFSFDKEAKVEYIHKVDRFDLCRGERRELVPTLAPKPTHRGEVEEEFLRRLFFALIHSSRRRVRPTQRAGGILSSYHQIGARFSSWPRLKVNLMVI
jgi:hypothetical protein